MKKARALKLIRRLKAAEGARSTWEDEFLDSVEERIGTYGRAFADPQKGGEGSAISVRQGVKLKEIGSKLAGEVKPVRPRKAWTRKTPLNRARQSRRRDAPEAEEEP